MRTEDVQSALEMALEDQDLATAADAAGVPLEAVRRAADTVNARRRSRRLTIGGAGLLLLLAALLWFGRSPATTLPIHNEARQSFRVDVLIPIPGARCAETEPLPVESFCRFRTLDLRAHARTRVRLPEVRCGRVWVRTAQDQALFELPAHVENESHGALDQKGLGAPNMFSAPLGQPAPDCGVHRDA